jgi:hypothetical protein
VRIRTIIVIIAAIMLRQALGAQGNGSPRKIDASQEKAVLEAVLDEIYDYGYQEEFWGFESSGPRGPQARFPVYFKPTLVPAGSCNGCQEGVIIYKYLPFGEMFRPFIIDSSGMVTLVGSPKLGFSWNKPASPTIYMNDDDVIKDKQQWLKAWLSIDLKPPKDKIRQSAIRQKQRIGYSKWLETRAQK